MLEGTDLSVPPFHFFSPAGLPPALPRMAGPDKAFISFIQIFPPNGSLGGNIL